MARLKISAMTTLSTLVGTERFPVYDPAGATAALQNKTVAVSTLNSYLTPYSIARDSASVVCNSGGSITISPAAASPNGTMGVTMSTPNLGSQGTGTTDQLKITSGNYQQGAALTLRAGLLCQPVFKIIADTYSTTLPRIYVNDGGGIYTQAWVVLSGTQTVGGTILPGSDRGSHLDIWQDVTNGIFVRLASGGTPANATALAIKSAGTDGVTESGNWLYAIRMNGDHVWGSVGFASEPYTLSSAVFGYSTGRLTASELTVGETGTLRVGIADQGALLSVTAASSTGALIGAASGAIANDGVLMNLSHTNAKPGSSVTGINAVVNTGVRGMMVFRNNGAGSAELVVEAGSTGDAFTRYLVGSVNWTTGADNSDSDKYKICRADYLDGSDALTFDSSLTAAFGGAIQPLQAADGAGIPNGSIYYSTTAGKLAFKDLAGVVQAVY